jgi:cellulose synthase/poly-beta-1,6-N-acetylglucosamine synthase-like glycosyltransferase
MKRFFEILPGSLAWGTIVGMVLFSWLLPVWVSIFIILFDIYWLLKTAYLSLHLRATFSTMRANMKIDWLARLDASAAGARATWRDIRHLVILPMYNEPCEVVRESFESLSKTHYSRENMIVVLALEERAGARAREVGERITKEFGARFGKFLVTIHPANVPGEIPGKGSNEAWAAREAKEKIIDPSGLAYENIMVSVFDVDTQVFPEYFGRLTHAFLHTENPMRAIYQPIPFFTNNIYEAPALARVVAFSTTFWQMMQQSRPERLTSFSSQSIPLSTLLDIGFWQKDIVSEDSRIFWQGYLHYHGDFRVEPLFYPVSMDANVAPTFWGTMKNIYKQQRRWGWGVENIPYMLEGFRRDDQISSAKKRYWRFNAIEGFHSWATNSLMIFALGWLPLLLGGHHFGSTLLAYYLPHVTRWIVSLSMLGIVSSAALAIMLLPPKPEGLRPHNYFIYVLQWILMPITLIIFGAFPGLEAQTRLMLGGNYRLGFWVTPKGRVGKHAFQS